MFFFDCCPSDYDRDCECDACRSHRRKQMQTRLDEMERKFQHDLRSRQNKISQRHDDFPDFLSFES